MKCTCDTPDGPGQHLENCESYLRYWEEDFLVQIRLAYQQIAETSDRPDAVRWLLDELVANTVSLVRSVRELGDSCVSDPEKMIRRAVRVPVDGPAEDWHNLTERRMRSGE